MDKYKLFLEKLTAITKETGVIIENFGDSFYDPRLISEGEDLGIYIVWDIEEEKYIARKDSPYDGEIV
jgi:hypothetical protein